MAWGALVKSVAKGAIKKKATKKGAEMAKNITNKKEKDNSSAIVVKEKSTTLAPLAPMSGGASDTPIQKPTTDGSPLDRIDSALLDIMKTLKSRRKLMLNKSRQNRVQSNKEKKAKREGLLERMKAGGKKMLSNVKAAATGWWERLQRFLLMTMLGALVLAIKNNWEAIKAQIDKVVKVVKDIWEFTSPILIPLFKALKWIAIQGFKMMAGIVTTDNKKIEKETDNLSRDLKKLKKVKEDVDGQFKKAEEGVKDLKDKKFSDLADKAGLNDEISPDSAAKSDVTKEQVQKEVGKKITQSDIEKHLASAEKRLEKYEKEGNQSKIEGVSKKISHYKKQLSGMKKYATGASPVPETGPAIVHKGEVIIPAPVVERVGGTMKIENILNMMQSSTTNIKQNPLKVISMMEGMSKEFAPIGEQLPTMINMMEGMSKEFAPIGEQLPTMINETIKQSKLGTVSKKVTKEMIEKMENTLNVLKEQTDYEEQSGNTLIISAPQPSRPSVMGGGGGTTVIPIGESGKTALNRYVNTLIQKTLY